MAHGVDRASELRSEHLANVAIREIEKRLEGQVGGCRHEMVDASDFSEDPFHIRFIGDISLMRVHISPKFLPALGQPLLRPSDNVGCRHTLDDLPSNLLANTGAAVENDDVLSLEVHRLLRRRGERGSFSYDPALSFFTSSVSNGTTSKRSPTIP